MKRFFIIGLFVLFAFSMLTASQRTVDDLYIDLVVTGATHDVAIDVIEASEIDDEENVLAVADGWYRGSDGTWFLIVDGKCVKTK